MSNENSNHEEEHNSHGTRHMLMMLLCCVLPIAAVFGLSWVFPGNAYVRFIAVAICPLSMVFMYLPDLLSKTKKKKEHNACH